MELLEKLKRLEENLKILKEIKESLNIEDIKSNRRYEWEIRYGLLESIQLIIDISCKIVSNYNLGAPKTYKECIKLLNKFNYLSSKLSLTLLSMVGLRNLLVHEYTTIDIDKLYSFLENLDDFYSFLKEIKKALK